jgi:hypothetical protein
MVTGGKLRRVMKFQPRCLKFPYLNTTHILTCDHQTFYPVRSKSPRLVQNKTASLYTGLYNGRRQQLDLRQNYLLSSRLSHIETTAAIHPIQIQVLQWLYCCTGLQFDSNRCRAAQVFKYDSEKHKFEKGCMKHQDTGRTSDASWKENDLAIITFSPNSKAFALFCLM